MCRGPLPRVTLEGGKAKSWMPLSSKTFLRRDLSLHDFEKHWISSKKSMRTQINDDVFFG
jgi:hypothetical protein